MNNKKIWMGVIGALLTAGGAIVSIISEVMPNNEKEEDNENDESQK